MTAMAKAKPASTGAEDGPLKPISYRPSRLVHVALEEYRSQFEFKPDKSAVLERALRDFLRAKGFDFPASDDE